MYRKMLALAACGALGLAVLAAPAGAAKSATKAQLRAIAKAMRTTPVGDANQLPKRWYRITSAKISTVSPSWAWATQNPTRAGRGKFQPAFFLLVQPAGLRTWTVVDLGTSEVGCGIAPNSVLSDLMGISGDPCPPGAGIPA